MSDLVWYAAYGSNLSAERFATYLNGGSPPHRPVIRCHDGARDSSAPLANHSWEIPHRLFFAASSSSWGGGSLAFLDPVADDSNVSLTRLWLITAQQFEDVFRQENRLAVPPPNDPTVAPLFTIRDLGPGEHCDVTTSWYGRVVHLGLGPDDHPVVTFTGRRSDRHQLGPAHPSYLRTMGIGLMDRFRLGPETAAEYLAGSEGNAGHIDQGALATDLACWQAIT